MAKLLAPALLAAALAGCSADPGNSSASATSTDAAGALLASIVKEIGANLDACFDGVPAMLGPGTPQSAPGVPDRPVGANKLIVAIDSSGSMAGQADGMSKMDAAKRAATAFLNNVPKETQVGLIVFGHKGSNGASGKTASCAGVEMLYPLGTADTARIDAAMGTFRATGWTPLASAITMAGNSFAPGDPGRQVVYIVSDGIETCGGDPVAAARALNTGPVRAIVNIIGFDLKAADRAQLKAVADAGGGTFVETQPSAIGEMLDDLQRKVGAVSAITRERFDAGGRTTDNNLAAARYTTNVNMCLYRGTTSEDRQISAALAKRNPTPELRDATLERLRARHEAYRQRAATAAAEVEAQRKRANDTIDAQTGDSEKRLGQ